MDDLSSYCGYDHMSCATDLEDVKERSNNMIQSILSDTSAREEAVDINQTPVKSTKERINDFTIIDLGNNPSATEFSDEPDVEEDAMAMPEKTKQEDSNSCRSILCSKKTFVVLAVFLAACLSLLSVATILREQRKQDSAVQSANAMQQDNSHARESSLPWDESDSKAAAERNVDHNGIALAPEGGGCDGNRDCESGICLGNAPPYFCQPKRSACHLCNDDRNCLSGMCVRRSGKSICAATEDGLMGVGCFCDADDDCFSNRCEGEPLMYTCQQRTSDCTSDLDCAGVCNNGQCSDGEMGSVGKRQPTGDRCSGHADCSSRICVGFSFQTDGVCSNGRVGSICGTNNDCITERCIQGFCENKQHDGGGCKGNVECASGLCFGYSHVNSGLCLSTSEENMCQGEGQACGDDGTCVGGFCKNFHLGLGSVCLDDSDCLTGDCSWSQTYAERRCRSLHHKVAAQP